MSNRHDRITKSAQRPGVGQELRNLRENGQASADELREFLRSIKGRSPQEVLGVVAESGLAKSLVVATVGCFVLLVVASVVPYAWNQLYANEPTAKAEQPEAEPTADAKAPAEPAKTANVEETPTTPTPENAPENLPDRLGIGETKTADPKVNPLDSNIDDLLDGTD